LNSSKETFIIYTDGSCLKNGVTNGGGYGGYGAILLKKNDTNHIDYKKNLQLNENLFFTSGFERNTTNNRMELSGAIAGLNLFISQFSNHEKNDLKNDFNIEIHVDSQYVKNGINDWIHNWKKNQWKTAAKTAVKNQDLWIQLDELNFFLQPSWYWVKGHSESFLNNLTDYIANQSAISQKILSEKEISQYF
jgi:ribonuclease HI